MAIECIRTQDIDGSIVWAPRVFCDACGEQITHAPGAWYLWFPDGYADGARGRLYFAHKAGRCIDNVQAEHSMPMASGELVDLPLFMARNMGSDANGQWQTTLGTA